LSCLYSAYGEPVNEILRDLHDSESGAESAGLESGDTDEAKAAGLAFADQAKSLGRRFCKAEFLCRLPPDTTAEVLQKLRALLIEPNDRPNAEAEKLPVRQNCRKQS
jgi:hypothetical protein